MPFLAKLNEIKANFVTNNIPYDEALLNKAFEVAVYYHKDQVRADNSPYVTHVLEVAVIATQMKLDYKTVIASLLHDTVEDTQYTLDQLKQDFGKEIATLVDGVTKLSEIKFRSENLKQAENFRKFFLASLKDIRILFIKLCDRLHNMRTLQHLSPRKQKAIAKETQEIYAPIARRFGIANIQEELEDLCFLYLEPDKYKEVVYKLKTIRSQFEPKLPEIVATFDNLFATKQRSYVTISSRTKTPVSVFRKMAKKNMSLDQISDIFGFRIIVNSPDDCYYTLGLLHQQWKAAPESFKDYISNPKNNGYQSLHTALFIPGYSLIEVQIRTQRMNEIAERGLAAHWIYKDTDSDNSKQIAGVVNQIRSLLKSYNTEYSVDFLEYSKLEMYTDEVFCYSPSGDLFVLPKGATVLDFAYGVHSEIGNHCVGAEINGKRVSIRQILNNKDKIKIITDENQSPQLSWEHYASTYRAKANIRRFFKQQNKDQYIDIGKRIVQSIVAYLNFETEEIENGFVKELRLYFNYTESDPFLKDIGRGVLVIDDVAITSIYNQYKKNYAFSGIKTLHLKQHLSGKDLEKDILLCEHCCPVIGDQVGFNINKFITLHRPHCKHLEDSQLTIHWKQPASQSTSLYKSITQLYKAHIFCSFYNKIGILGKISAIIKKQEANIVSLNEVASKEGLVTYNFLLEVEHTLHIERIINALIESKVVIQAFREE